jgi:hypothetical protein
VAVKNVFPWIEARKVLPNDLRGFVSFGSFGSGIPSGDPTVWFQHEHCIVLHTLNKQPEWFFSLMPMCLGQKKSFFLHASAAAIVFGYLSHNTTHSSEDTHETHVPDFSSLARQLRFLRMPKSGKRS